jgi:hypothetical protein
MLTVGIIPGPRRKPDCKWRLLIIGMHRLRIAEQAAAAHIYAQPIAVAAAGGLRASGAQRGQGAALVRGQCSMPRFRFTIS